MTQYDTLILDHDGVVMTVLDGDARAEACLRVGLRELQDRELSLPRDTIETLAHSVSPGTVTSMSQRLDTTPERLWRFRDDVLEAVLTDAAAQGTKRPYPDVDALSDLDAPVGIASNNQRRVVESLLEEYGLASQFETVRAREPELASLNRKKPAPTFLERAWDDVGGSNPLYVGDKGTDILAARRAGIDVAFLRREHNRDRSLDYEPTYEVDTLDTVVGLFE